jgi:hypothetical protein
LGLSKFALQNLIASIDKQPFAEMPSHLVGKSKQPYIHSANEVSSPMTFRSLNNATSPATSAAMSQDEYGASSAGGAGDSAGELGSAKWGADNTVKSPGSTEGPVRARMLYDFEAAPQSQEVSARAGDELEILEQQDDGWWRARLYVNGVVHEGYIPGNYTELIS